MAVRRLTFHLLTLLGCATAPRAPELSQELHERSWTLRAPPSPLVRREVVRIIAESPRVEPAGVSSELDAATAFSLRPAARAPARRERRVSTSPPTPIVVGERLAVVPLPPATIAARGGAAAGALDRTSDHVAEVVVPQASTGVLDRAAGEAYDDALSLVRADRCHDALSAFASFVSRWPDHPHADNAMYWRGECLLRLGETQRGIEEFTSLLRRYPAGNKAPDALLKLFLTWRRLGDDARASEAALRLQNEFPGSEAARRAHAERQMR